MRSTAYVIELVIAGAGAVLWLSLLLMALFGISWIPMALLKEPGFIIILSPFVYVIGVVIDRLIDNFFDKRFKENYTNPLFLKKKEYIMARTRIYLASDSLQGLFEYGKMRIRICRAWAFNSFLILIAADLFLLLPRIDLPLWPDRLRMIAAVTLFFGLSARLSFKAWKTLSIKEAEFLRMQNEVLKELKEESK